MEWARNVVGYRDKETDADDTEIVRELRKYYTTNDRPLPEWLPADPRAPVRPAPAQMVSSSGMSQISQLSQRYGNSTSNSDAMSASQTNLAPQGGNATSKPGITSIAAMQTSSARSNVYSQSDKLRAKFGGNRSASPANQGSAASSPGLGSVHSSNPYENSLKHNSGGGGARSGSRNPYAGRDAQPAMTANAPWSGGDADYNSFTPYDGSNPYGAPGGGDGNRTTGPTSGGGGGLVRGPRGMYSRG